MKLITDGTKLKAAIKSIANRGKKLDADIHVAATSVLEHVKQHGDTTVVASLVSAMPKSARRKALIHWVKAFAPISVEQDKSGKVTAKLNPIREADKSDFAIEDAFETPFWDFTPEKEVKPMTFEKLMAYVEKHAVEIDGVSDEEAAAMLTALNTIHGNMAAKAA